MVSCIVLISELSRALFSILIKLCLDTCKEGQRLLYLIILLPLQKHPFKAPFSRVPCVVTVSPTFHLLSKYPVISLRGYFFLLVSFVPFSSLSLVLLSNHSISPYNPRSSVAVIS